MNIAVYMIFIFISIFSFLSSLKEFDSPSNLIYGRTHNVANMGSLLADKECDLTVHKGADKVGRHCSDPSPANSPL